jgi:hypothetical protein
MFLTKDIVDKHLEIMKEKELQAQTQFQAPDPQALV